MIRQHTAPVLISQSGELVKLAYVEAGPWLMHLTLTSLYGRYPILQPYSCFGASAPENLPYQLYGFDVPPRLSLDITCQRHIACPSLPCQHSRPAGQPVVAWSLA